MSSDELRNQEAHRHEEQVDQNVEDHQAINLNEKQRGLSKANQNSTVSRVVNISYFVFGALELLLFVRLVLQLIGVNSENGFANLIYNISYPFVAGFVTLLQNPSFEGAGTLEVTTIIAMLVWAILAWLVARFIWLILSRPR